MKYPKNPKLTFCKIKWKITWQLSCQATSKDHRSVSKSCPNLVEKNLRRIIPGETGMIFVSVVVFGLKSFIWEGKQGNKAFHDLYIHVHDCSNRCSTKLPWTCQTKDQLHFQFEDFSCWHPPPSVEQCAKRKALQDWKPIQPIPCIFIDSNPMDSNRNLGTRVQAKSEISYISTVTFPRSVKKDCCAAAWGF